MGTKDCPRLSVFRSGQHISAQLIDDKIGKIKFNFEPASENSSHSKLISAFDLQQLLALQVTSALFSLDQPDADHRFHPFQKMRFIPERIYYSQLQQSMLDADYLLKFFG